MTENIKKNNWKKIWEFIKSRIFTVIIIIILIIVSAIQCSRIEELKRQQEISNQNVIALNDSIKYQKLKTGELEASKAILVADNKTLKDLNSDLFRRWKEQEGKVIDLTHAVIQLRQDSTILEKYLIEKDKEIKRLLQIDESTYMAAWKLPFSYDSTNFDVFSGKTYIGVKNKDPLELVHIDTKLTERLTQIDMEFGTRIKNDLFNVYLKSKYPGFTVAQLDGVLIDPNTNPYIKKLIHEKRWFQGFGVGPQAAMGFNVTTGKYGLVLGAGIHYTIYRF